MALERSKQHRPSTRGPDRSNSGFVILRFARDFPVAEDQTNLNDLAIALDVPALKDILDQYHLSSTERLIRSATPQQILALEAQAAQTVLAPRRSLARYWRIDARHRPQDLQTIVGELNRLSQIDQAYAESEVEQPSPIDYATDTYSARQGFLEPAGEGINAKWASDQPNGTGAGVGLVVVEQDLYPDHRDLKAKAPRFIYGDNRAGVAAYSGHHGTAVLGIIVAEDNNEGVVGIAPDTNLIGISSHYDHAAGTNLHVSSAITAAVVGLTSGVVQVGDVLLLEVERSGLPTETDPADFDAIRLASALGLVVIEAAGNGTKDLDEIPSLDRSSASTFQDSGATLVGASNGPSAHVVHPNSNYGSRIDCFAWGTGVVTSGYGPLTDPTPLPTGEQIENTYYTDNFGMTSAASAIVAGAALIVQGMYKAATTTVLSPLQMRLFLPLNGTTSPDPIGNMPDLMGLLDSELHLVPDPYLRDHVGDDGTVPSSGSLSSSPDIIVRPDPVANPTALFGEGSGNENSNLLGWEVEAGQDNFIYVRMKNRGKEDAAQVRATVYWSEPATLITPDLWKAIGQTSPVDVPEGNTLVVSDPLIWPQAEIPATGHYCFIALLGNTTDPVPTLPAGFDFDLFKAFVRNLNNVAWRNFNVVNKVEDAEEASLFFYLTGTPDQAREFDFEIIPMLPKPCKIWLEGPKKLLGQLQAYYYEEPPPSAGGDMVRLKLPSLKLLRAPNLSLPAGAKYPCRCFISNPQHLAPGHSIAVRQLHNNVEVGRITWAFAPSQQKTA